MAVKDEKTTSKVDETSSFLVNVNLVLARVVVRDAHGHAVGGLHKEDFELFDNGKPELISHFDEQHLSVPDLSAPTTAAASESLNAPNPAQTPSIPVRYVAYLFDDLHLSFENINRVRKAAERRVDTLPSTGRIAIFSTSGQGTIDFTDDRAKLHQALESLRPRPTLGGEIVKCPDISFYMADLIVNKNDPEALQTAASHPCATGPSSTEFVRGVAMQVLTIGQEDSRSALNILKKAVSRLTVMPGQRNLVLVSPGFLIPELEYENEAVIDRALRAQVVINTLDARGLYVDLPFGDASQRGQADVDIPGQSYTPSSRTQLDERASSAQAAILADLAYNTGGTFFHNNNDMDEGFRRVADAPESFYLLGFTPRNLKLDGKFHALRVSLKTSEKYDIQARRGYYAPNRKEDPAELAKRELDEELYSDEELHGLPVELHTQFFKLADDNARLTVLARLYVRNLQFKKAEGRNQNNVTIMTAVFDGEGNFLQGNQKLVEMRWKDETLQGKLNSGITFKSSFDLKPGRYLVRLVARDTEQQKMSAESGAVEIP